MCILTVVPITGALIITSNRDEQRTRANSVIPSIEKISERETIIARDRKANGTWILTDDRGRTAVLLNGAFESHTPIPPYRESRGITLINLFEEEDIKKAFQLYNLNNIEPFQIIVIDKSEGFHLLWDGNEKHAIPIALNKPHVVFSSTQNNKQQREVKRNHFLNAYKDLNECNAKWIFNFHSIQTALSSETDFFMNRNLHVTKSITQIEINSNISFYKHLQTWDNQLYEHSLEHVSFI
jgi:hypothetical protein